jgi:VWFA-related protein
MRLGTGSAIQDAIFLGADEILNREQGRKAIVLLSDGGENGSRTSLSTAIETVQRADTLIYTIRFYERPGGFFVRLSRPAREGISRMEASQLNLMRRLARETGGDYFDRNEQSLDDIYQSIEEDLRHQYSLGYTPNDPQSGYRRIRLTVKRPGLSVRTREGYYGA